MRPIYHNFGACAGNRPRLIAYQIHVVADVSEDTEEIHNQAPVGEKI